MREDNNIPKGWVETKLGNHLKIGRGSSPRPIHKYISTEGIPWVKIADATASNNKYIEKTNEFIIEEGRSTSVKHGDLIVSNSATPGIPKFMAIDACVHDGWLVFSEYNGIDKLYLYYFFLFFRRELNHSATGTVFKNLKTDIVRNVELLLPPKEEQQAIASILTTFDDKIELLQAQNQTLEATAQTIFKEWFGKYQVGDVLPEGWRVGKLGEELNTSLGGTPARKKPEYWENGNIPWINSGAVNNFRIIEGTEFITKEGLEKSATKLLPKGTVILAITGATLGQYSKLEIDCCFNQSVVGITESDIIHSSYIYFWIANNIHEIIRSATGGAQQHINKGNVDSSNIIIPKNDILNEFYQVADPIMNKIAENLFQIQTLQQTRDTLLPKLMSGRLRVEEFRD